VERQAACILFLQSPLASFSLLFPHLKRIRHIAVSEQIMLDPVKWIRGSSETHQLYKGFSLKSAFLSFRK
jgi:hypothetical protein